MGLCTCINGTDIKNGKRGAVVFLPHIVYSSNNRSMESRFTKNIVFWKDGLPNVNVCSRNINGSRIYFRNKDDGLTKVYRKKGLLIKG